MSPKDLVRQAVQRELGMAQDNLARAQCSFLGSDLRAQYGFSGQTKAQILADYQRREKQCQAAMDWIESK